MEIFYFYNRCLLLEGHYALSIEHYSKAIEFNPKEASYYGNRSFAYLRSEFYGIL